MKVSHDNIATFLYTPGRYFIVPDFQRPYSWDRMNVNSFLEDLNYVIEKDINHYFGSVVFINEGNNKVIIDGQQRATTVLLMLTALYHLIQDNAFLSKITAQAIKDQYLYNSQTYSEESNRIKLKTVTTDNEIFEKIFERTKPSHPENKSKLYQAYESFYHYFKEKNNLHCYVDALEKFEIVTIALDSSDDNPQKIFESINSTGKPLNDGDKIRNFSLMLNDKDARSLVFKNYWHHIEKKLIIGNDDYISDFFKHFLTSKLCKDIKTEQVYNEFKNLFFSSLKCNNINFCKNSISLDKLESFYDEIVNFLDYYAFLKFNEDKQEKYKIIIDKGFRLNYLKIEIIFPFLMQVLDYYNQNIIDNKELLKVFNVVEIFLARRIICNIQTTGLNTLFYSLHKEVKNYLKKYKNYHYVDILVFILMSKDGHLRMPGRNDVQYAIKNNSFYNQKKHYNSFILSSIDDKSRESTLLKQIANSEVELSIEHIMPCTLNKSWKECLGQSYEEIHEKYLHTLPNLTLTGYNSKYSNRDFNDKKGMRNGFNESPLLINQYLKNIQKWDESSLEQRADWWLEQIEELWPVPELLFKPEVKEKELDLIDEMDVTHLKLKEIIILDESTSCRSWSAAIEIFLQKFFMLADQQLREIIILEPTLSKFIKTNGESFRRAALVEGTPFYREANLNANQTKNIITLLANRLEMEKTDIRIVLAD